MKKSILWQMVFANEWCRVRATGASEEEARKQANREADRAEEAVDNTNDDVVF